MKGKIINSEVEGEQYPPLGSVGIVRLLPNQKYAFTPDDVEHYPPDCNSADFDYYEVRSEQICLISL